METIFSKRNLPVVILNVITILVVAVMLIVNQAIAKPDQSSKLALSSGVLSYQGTLMDSNGNPLSGTYEITFRIYDAPSGGTLLWEEARTGGNGMPVQEGLFNVMLGSLNPIPTTIWEASELFLGIKIGTDAEMAPREKLTAVPSAAMAEVAQLAISVPDGSIRSRHFAPAVYEAFNHTTKENATADYMSTGTSVTFVCEVNCTIQIIHRGLTVHSNQGRVDVSIKIDDTWVISELSDSPLFFQNVSGQGIFDLPAGSHTVEVFFMTNPYDPGVSKYYGDESGNWEHLYVMVFAQD